MKKRFDIFGSYMLLFCFIYSSNHSFAQKAEVNSKNTSFTLLSVGYEKSYFKDENYALLNQQGNGTVLQFQFQKKLKADDLFSIAFDLPFAITKPKATDHFKAIQTISNIEVAYLKKLSLKNDQIQFYVLVFYNGTAAFTMFGTNGLDASAQLNYIINKKQMIHTKISMPLVAQLVRPPYTGWDKFITDNYKNIPKVLTRGKITSLNQFFGINFDLNYEYQYKDNRSLLINYGLRYYTTNEVKQSNVLNNQITVGLNFKR